MFVSEAFFKSNFIILSNSGSIHLFKNVNISLIVISAILTKDDLNESATFKTSLTKKCSYVPCYKIKFE